MPSVTSVHQTLVGLVQSTRVYESQHLVRQQSFIACMHNLNFYAQLQILNPLEVPGFEIIESGPIRIPGAKLSKQVFFSELILKRLKSIFKHIQYSHRVHRGLMPSQNEFERWSRKFLDSSFRRISGSRNLVNAFFLA